MPSRMERYYKTDLPKQRSNMNKPLYDSIYEKGSYTNIEGIATIDKPNEIDIDQIRKLIKPEQEKKNVALTIILEEQNTKYRLKRIMIVVRMI